MPFTLRTGELACLIAYNDHGRYCVPVSSAHRPAAQAVIGTSVHEAETVDLLRRFARSGDVVHAGTFFGDFLPALASSRRRSAKVWAFEPNSENYWCAQLTILLNDLRNVVLTRAALDASAGVGRLMTNLGGRPLGGGSLLVTDTSYEDAQFEEVPLVAIDDAVPADRRVAVVHLDVEGNEQRALTGAMKTIARCRPLLVLESMPEAQWFDSHLAPLGYRVDRQVHDNTVLRAR